MLGLPGNRKAYKILCGMENNFVITSLLDISYSFCSYLWQRWSNRTRVLVLEYEYFLSTRTRVRRKVIVLVLEYITKVIVLTITSHDYIFFI